MVWPNILNGDDTPLCLHLLEDKDTTGNDLFFKAKLKESFLRFWKVPHLSSSRWKYEFGGFISSRLDCFMTHCPMRSVIKLSHLQVMNTVSRLPTGSRRGGGGGREKFYPNFRHRRTEIDLSITSKAVYFFFLTFFPCTLVFLSSPEIQTEKFLLKPLKVHILHFYHLTAVFVRLLVIYLFFMVVFFS